MWKRAILVSALLAGFAGTLPAQRSVEFEGRYWIPQLNGRIRVDRNGLGTDIDFVHDLGMSDKNFPEGKFTYQGAGRNKLFFSFTPIDYDGNNTVSRTISFNGRQYTLGTQVVSNLEVKHLQFGWAYQFVNVHDGAFRLGPLVEANGFLMKGRLRAPALSLDEKEELSAGLPTVGIALDINPHRMVNLFGQFSGMSVGDYGYFVEGEGGIKVRPVKYVFVTAGYRTFNLHIKDKPDFARLVTRGPFVGAGFRF